MGKMADHVAGDGRHISAACARDEKSWLYGSDEQPTRRVTRIQAACYKNREQQCALKGFFNGRQLKP